jgi:O-succinylbenzoate synthase
VSLAAVELVRLELPLVSPFRTSFGTSTTRDVLLVHVVTSDAEGWGECVTDSTPLYSSEYVDGAAQVIRQVLVPAIVAARTTEATEVERTLARFKGHRMAKAAVHTALLDAELRAAGRSLAHHLGASRDRVDCGVSVGIMDSLDELLTAVDGYLAQGYRRIKLKIEPGWDVEPVRVVRESHGAGLSLQVDANAAYSLAESRACASARSQT